MSEELDYRTERKVTWAQVVMVVLLIEAIALSIFVIRPIASSPGTYTQSFAYLDEKIHGYGQIFASWQSAIGTA